MAELPTGTVTFFFSDIEGSTRLIEALGTQYGGVLERHHALIREAFAAHRGTEIGTEGDSFFAVFPTAGDALQAAVDIQRRIDAADWPTNAIPRVRIGLHTGEGRIAADSYVGLDVHRASRIMSAAHGGQILVSEATRALAARSLPQGVALHDLGEHRLRDLSGRERLYQVNAPGLREEFPAPRTLDATPNNLPIQLTSFLGREPEIAEVVERLRRGRLLTMTGPGGTGKTRLSLQAAARLLDEFPDGVFFVPLAPIGDPALVAATIAQHVGLPERGGADPLASLREHLRNRELLLVIDNFEQVLPAATVVRALLEEAPRLKVLVTSRAALHVSGEQRYPVPSLGVPDPKDLPDQLTALSQYESVALFIERAAAVRPDFAITNLNAPAVAEICVRLDGLPLAIELAAARIAILTPQAILERLGGNLDLLAGGARDLPDRQRTLRGAIDWSYGMLEEPDRSLFACLSVFVGGTSLDAADAVCGGVIGADVLDPLESLVEKSLVRQSEGVGGEPRFSMLETIREFALERSRQSGQHAESRRRQATWVLDLAEQARPALITAERRTWLDRLDQEHDNIRAAIGWAIEEKEAEIALRFVAALWRFWQFRGYLAEGHERARAAIDLPSAGEHPRELLGALEAAGGLAYWRALHGEARQHYQRALELARQLGDRSAEAEQLYNLSFTHAVLTEAERTAEDIAEARRLLEQSLALFTELHDRSGQAKATWALSENHFVVGEYEESLRRGRYALDIFTELGDRNMAAWSRWDVATSSFKLGRLAEARDEFASVLETFAEAQDVSGHVIVLTAFAALAATVGDRARAARLSGAAAALGMTSGTGLEKRIQEGLGFDPQPLRTDPETQEAWKEGERMGLEGARDCALALSVPREPPGSPI